MTAILETIKSWFSAVYNWLSKFWDWLQAAFQWLLDGLLYLLKFVAYTLLDGLLSVVEAVLNTIDFSSVVFNYAAAWSHLPDQLIWLINALGLPQCFTILGSAYLIRLLLNLIPSVFTRV
jgi:ABC-type proline/glycine betaine transport system permease subunit